MYRDPGDALSAWSDANPQAHRLNHWIFTAAGNASEVWVLFVVPVSAIQDEHQSGIVNVGKPRRKTVSSGLGLITVMACIVGVFFALGFLIVLIGGQGAGQGGDLADTGIPALIFIGLMVGLQRFRRSPFGRGGLARRR